MSFELINKIETQVKELEDRMRKNSDFVNSAVASMEKLATDKAAALNDSHIVNGAVQAYKNVVEELRKILGRATPVAQSVGDVVVDVAKVAVDIASGNIGGVLDHASEIIDGVGSVVDAVESALDK